MNALENEWHSLLEATLLGLLNGIDEGALVFDDGGSCRMVGSQVGDFFGFNPAELIGVPRPQVLRRMGECTDDPAEFFQHFGKTDLDLGPTSFGQFEIHRPVARQLLWTSYPLEGDGRRLGRLVLIRDVTKERAAARARQSLERRLELASPVDPQTGLPNARRFREEHEREFQRAKRSWDSYGLVFVKLPALEGMAEVVGSAGFDRYLDGLASLLKEQRRAYDVVARLEDACFAVLLPGADEVGVKAVGERIVAGLGAFGGEIMLLSDIRVLGLVMPSRGVTSKERVMELAERSLASISTGELELLVLSEEYA